MNDTALEILDILEIEATPEAVEGCAAWLWEADEGQDVEELAALYAESRTTRAAWGDAFGVHTGKNPYRP